MATSRIKRCSSKREPDIRRQIPPDAQLATELDPEYRIDILRTYIRDYDKGWELVNIGPASGGLIPMTFRERVAETVG